MIKVMTIKRVASNRDGTFGVLVDRSNTPFALTLENPWLDNKKKVSCIPGGTYNCKRIISPKFGETFEVLNVPERSHILFHKGNVSEDTEGCVLIGEQYEYLYGKVAVLSSQKGFSEFMKRLKGINDFFLVVMWS